MSVPERFPSFILFGDEKKDTSQCLEKSSQKRLLEESKENSTLNKLSRYIPTGEILSDLTEGPKDKYGCPRSPRKKIKKIRHI